MNSEGSEEYNVNDGYESDGYNGAASLQQAPRAPWEVPQFSPRTSTRYAEHRKSRLRDGSMSAASWADSLAAASQSAAATYSAAVSASPTVEDEALREEQQASKSRSKRYSEMRRVSSLLHKSQEALRSATPTSMYGEASTGSAPQPVYEQDGLRDKPKRKSYAEMRKSTASSSAAPIYTANGEAGESRFTASQHSVEAASPAPTPSQRYAEIRKSRLSVTPSQTGIFFDADRMQPSGTPSTGSTSLPMTSARASSTGQEAQATGTERTTRYSKVRKSKSMVQVNRGSVYDPDQDAWMPAPEQVRSSQRSGGGDTERSASRAQDSQRWLDDVGDRMRKLEDAQQELRGDMQRIKQSQSTLRSSPGDSSGMLQDIDLAVKRLEEKQHELGDRVKTLEEDVRVFGEGHKRVSQHLENVELDLARHFAALRDEVKSRIQASEQRLLAKVLKDVEERLTAASPYLVRTPPVQPFSFEVGDAEHGGPAQAASERESPRPRSSASSSSLTAQQHQQQQCRGAAEASAKRQTGSVAESVNSRRSFMLRSKSAIQEAEDTASEASVSDASRRYAGGQSQPRDGYTQHGGVSSRGAMPPPYHDSSQGRQVTSERSSFDRVSARAMTAERPGQRLDPSWQPGTKDSEGRLVF